MISSVTFQRQASFLWKEESERTSWRRTQYSLSVNEPQAIPFYVPGSWEMGAGVGGVLNHLMSPEVFQQLDSGPERAQVSPAALRGASALE